jgi:hypothetical protein
MSAWTKLAWVGAVLLVMMPFVHGVPATILQVTAGLIMGLALLAVVVARTSLPRLVLVTRVLFATLFFTLCAEGIRTYYAGEAGDLFKTFALFALGAFFGLMAYEPLAPARSRCQVLAVARISLGAAIYLAMAFALRDVKISPAAFGPMVVFIFNRRKKSKSSVGISSLEQHVHRLRDAAVEFVVGNTGPTLRLPFDNSPRRADLIRSLSQVASTGVSAEDRYAKLLGVCRRYPRVGLAWQVAYSAAIAHEDWSTANELSDEAARYGILIGCARPEVLPMLADRLGPRWREIVRADDLRSVLAASEDGPRSVIDSWREADPAFAQFETIFAPNLSRSG